MTRKAVFAVWCLLAATMLTATRLSAQQIQGTVSDSTSRRAVAGAVVMLLDSAGGVVARGITNERGQYALTLEPQAQRIRAQRIGFRPRELRLSVAASGARLDIAMIALPTFLEPVRVTASSCGRRSDEGSALSLLEQARAGLLTTVVAREAKPAAMTLYTFDRLMDGTTDRIERQTVRVDSSRRHAVSFSAVHDAKAFVRRGFMDDGIGGQTFFAPDADVLLDDGFATGYCFRVVSPERSRPNQVGLGFVAADRKRDRVDIDGVLWIDTSARALREIEFKYVGLDPRIQRFEPGGSLAFRELPNGVVLVDRWLLRLVGAHHDTVPRSRTDRVQVDLRFYGSHNGGELAHAIWPDGSAWHAPLGVLDVRGIRADGRPAAGIHPWLAETPYHAVADSNGRFTIRDLVPGPYALAVVDSALAPLKLTIPTELWFMSQRDTARFIVRVPTLDEFVVERCKTDGRYRSKVTDSIRVIARAMAPDSTPLGDVEWRAKISVSPDDFNSWTPLREGGRTGTNGVMPMCESDLKKNATVEIVAGRRGYQAVVVRHRLTERVNVIPIVLQPSR